MLVPPLPVLMDYVVTKGHHSNVIAIFSTRVSDVRLVSQ